MVIINPGTGPVEGTRNQAKKNMQQFLQDLQLPKATMRFIREEEDGRFTFHIKKGDHVCEVEMPGLPIEQVRWIDDPDQNIWHFPRLYVDGSSWVWHYALSAARDRLLGVTDEEDE